MAGGRGLGEMDLFGFLDAPDADVIAIAALPEYVAEVDRLLAWVEYLEGRLEELRYLSPSELAAVRAGEWPEGSKP